MAYERNDDAELLSLVRKNSIELKKYMQPRPQLIKRLQRRRIIDNHEAKEIQDCDDQEEANEMILKNCMSEQGRFIKDLIKALKETDQEDLVDEFLTPSGNREASNEQALNPTPVYQEDDSSQSTLRTESRLKEFHVKPSTSIKDALNDIENEAHTFVGTVIFKSEEQTYTKKNGAFRSYVTAIVCDSTDVAEMRIYSPWNYENVEQGKTYKFNEVIRQDEEFLLGGRARFHKVPWISIPDKLIKKGEKRKQAVLVKERSLAEALETTKSSNIRGKITKVSPVSYVKDGSLAVRYLALLDQSRVNVNPVKVTIFGAYAEQSYEPGACVEITDVYPEKARNKEEGGLLTLSTRKESTVKILEDPEEHAELFNLEYQGTIKDKDFPEPVDAEVVGVESSKIYSSCANPVCKNKKMNQDGCCPKCLSTGSGKYCWARLVVRYQDKEVTGVKVFKSDLMLMFELRDLNEYEGDKALADHITEQLSKKCNVKAWFTGNVMKVGSTKRSHSMMD